MRHNGAKAALAAAVALLAAACGGGSDNPAPPPTYARLVSFGDSLSDVGTYRTEGMKRFFGGGQFTVNDFNPATRPKGGTNWTEQLAHELALPAPCAARTGLNSPATGPLAVLAEPVADHPGCLNYAQGGARVTEPFGPGNAASLAVGDPRGYLGALTEPVAAQIAHHLAVAGGGFAADDLVTVLAGGNDALVQLAPLVAAAQRGAGTAEITALVQQAAGALTLAGTQLAGLVQSQVLAKGAQRVALVQLAPLVAAAGRGAGTAEITALVQQAAGALTLAGTQLAGLVQSQVLAKGAQRVALVLLPDIGVTPAVAALSAEGRTAISQLSVAFNTPLMRAFAGDPRVLLVDAFTASELQRLDPAKYGLSNATTPACDPGKASSAVLCSTATVRKEADAHYWFSDDVHLTPYGYQLLARVVSDAMTSAGWLAASGSRPCNAQADGCTLAPLPQ